MKRKKFRLELISGILIVLFLIGSTFMLLRDRDTIAAGSDQKAPAPPPKDLVPGRDRQETIIASGRVVPVKQAELQLPVNNIFTNGVVAEVLVSEGDVVKQGDVLARMDTRELELRARAAEAALAQAQAGYDGQRNANELERLRRELDTARILAEAETARLKALAEVANIRANAQQARLQGQYSVAETLEASAFRLFEASQIMETTVVSSQEQLNHALEMIGSMSNASLNGAQARIDQASAELDQARLTLEQATLRAPIDGTVVRVTLKPNQAVNTEVPAVTIGDLSAWQVVTEDLEELEVARIEKGQPVTVTLDALPDLNLAGTVSQVGRFGIEQDSGSGMSFSAVITLDQHDPRLHWNMTARLTFANEHEPSTR